MLSKRACSYADSCGPPLVAVAAAGATPLAAGLVAAFADFAGAGEGAGAGAGTGAGAGKGKGKGAGKGG